MVTDIIIEAKGREKEIRYYPIEASSENDLWNGLTEVNMDKYYQYTNNEAQSLFKDGYFYRVAQREPTDNVELSYFNVSPSTIYFDAVLSSQIEDFSTNTRVENLNSKYGVKLYEFSNNTAYVVLPKGDINFLCYDNINETFAGCRGLTGNILPDRIHGTNAANAYFGDYFLNASPVCGDNVVNMFQMYRDCRSLIGAPVCGQNVENAFAAYHGCSNLTGYPECGSNVQNMAMMYTGCRKLTGSPMCGDNVVNMAYSYADCPNLIGNPVCGPNVVDMFYAYANCTNLIGNPVCGDNVIDLGGAYYDCPGISGDLYWNYQGEERCYADLAFYNFYSAGQYLNIHVYPDSGPFNAIYGGNIIGRPFTWQEREDGNGYFNSFYSLNLFNNLGR